MGATLITGATGLIGARLARLLAQRGHELRLLVREGSSLAQLADLPGQRVRGDILDRRALRRALRGVELVFHCAGMTSLRARREELERANVDGTRIVLEECLRARVTRVVYCSSIAAIGPAERGSTADEQDPFNPAGCGIPYVDTKREAEVQALRLAARGLPVVVVCPALAFGGDPAHPSNGLVRCFLQRRIPAYVAGAINIVDADDVAEGLLLAAERGVVGDRYILGNRNYTLDRLFADLARLSDVEPPALRLPLPAALAFAEAAERLPGRPVITRTEVRAMSLWWACRNTKAKRELGWRPRPHEETIERTIAWYRSRPFAGLAPPGARQPLAYRVAGFATRNAAGVLSYFAS